MNTLTFQAGITHNDTTLKACFPYVQGPWRGFTGQEYKGPTTLPVTYVGFTAKGIDKTSQLQWQVANQVNVNHYEVEAGTRCKPLY